MTEAPYIYQCEIFRWLDGDTVDLMVDLGFGISMKERVRIYGINAHEIHSADSEEKSRGMVAKGVAMKLAPENSKVLVHTHKASQVEEKFGRWLADITLPDGADFAKAMIAAGQAVPYFGGARPKP